MTCAPAATDSYQPRPRRKVNIMSENTTVPTELTSQYTAQVTTDLEHNLKERERVSGETAAPQQQLAMWPSCVLRASCGQPARGLARARWGGW